jgi:solute carrier family 50 (sugar transporter)
MDWNSFLLHHAVPCLGVLLALAIYVSPLPAIRAAIKANSLSTLSPSPFPLIVANCLIWIYYGLLIRDIWVFGSNYFGVLLGLYYVLVSYRLGSDAIRRKLTFSLLFWFAFATTGAVISFIFIPNYSQAYGSLTDVSPYLEPKFILGVFTLIILSAFYASPLTTLYKVVATRNAIHFSKGLAITSFCNSVTWTVYGLYLGDLFIWLPNAVGIVLSSTQIICIIVFPRKMLIPPGKCEEQV